MIYLDYHATTPVDPRVLNGILPYFSEKFGNPASTSHAYGWTAEAAVDKARDQVADLIGAGPKEIVFTAGATEANNLAIQGVARRYRDQGRHLVTTPIEHKSVLDVYKHLANDGFRITLLEVDAHGRVDPAAVERALTDETILVSVMHANNEIGTIQPIADIGKICKDRGVLFHTDAAQSFGKVAIDVEEMGVDLLSCSGHKIYAPKGVGALFIRRKHPRVSIEPLLYGGGQERGLRSGTLNVPGIVGLGLAAYFAGKHLEEETERIKALRDRLYQTLSRELPNLSLNGPTEERLPGNLHVSIAGTTADELMLGLKEIALSSGSACTSSSLEPSHVLKAVGLSAEAAHSSLRFGLGRFTTDDEIDQTIQAVLATVRRIREANPLYNGTESNRPQGVAKEG